MTGKPELSYYTLFHHSLLHGLTAALLIPGFLALFATRRLLVLCLGFLIYHLHLLCDFLGSRGLTPQDIWPIPYLAPFSEHFTLSWSGQWPLNSWINITFTLLLLLYVFYRALKSSYSPIGLFHQKADIAFTIVLWSRWQSLWCKRQGNISRKLII